MARGLSALQKYILKASAAKKPIPLSEVSAWDVRREAGENEYRKLGRLLNNDICFGFYGWVPVDSHKMEWDKEKDGWRYVNTSEPPKDPYHRTFDPNDPLQKGDRTKAGEEEGRKKYTSARVAILKACRRLEERGLVECIAHGTLWAGIEITDKGREKAATITESLEDLVNG